jgi:hypothetical protein
VLARANWRATKTGHGSGNPSASYSTIRAAALDTIRTMWAAKIASEHRRAEAVRQGDTPEKRMTAPPPRVVVVALRNRLGAAIAKDWLVVAGLAADRHNTALGPLGVALKTKGPIASQPLCRSCSCRCSEPY